MNVSFEYAKKLAEKWEDGTITVTPHYYRAAKECLNAFRDYLSPCHHSLLVGMVEFYNHHK